MVASIALEFEAASGLYVVMRSLIAESPECLVRNGARIGVDSPTLKRLRRRQSSSNVSSSEDDDAPEGSSTTDVARSRLKLDSNKQALKILGGDDRLNLAKKERSGADRNRVNSCDQ